MLSKLLAVAAGGALGATARYAIHLFWVGRVQFPLGTLSANVLGAVAIGVIMYVVNERAVVSDTVRLLVVTGLLGSLTTFSTFSYETFELFDQGKHAWAGANLVANLALCLAGVWAGWSVTARLVGA